MLHAGDVLLCQGALANVSGQCWRLMMEGGKILPLPRHLLGLAPTTPSLFYLSVVLFFAGNGRGRYVLLGARARVSRGRR